MRKLGRWWKVQDIRCLLLNYKLDKMKYRLNLEVLRPGDVILIGYNDDSSRELQNLTHSDYSHAMLMWYGSVIHAKNIIITENPSRMLFDEDEKVCVMRLKSGEGNEMRIPLIIDYARSKVGTLYDTEALNDIKAGREPILNPNRQMCSTFIADCFDYALIDLVGGKNICSPADLRNSTELGVVENCLVPASEWDIMFANSQDVTKYQYIAIRKCIRDINKNLPNSDIMCLEQLEEYIDDHPDVSDIVIAIMKRTDYFQIWSMEEEMCHYLYDASDFERFWQDKSARMALDVKRDTQRIMCEETGKIAYYDLKIRKKGKLSYYEEMRTLHQNILCNCQKRIDVVEEVLKRNTII